MKISNTFFILIVTMLAVFAFGTTANGQLLLEDFSYTSGTNLSGQGGWTAHSGTGTNPPHITAGGLTYTGYTGSGIGNAVAFTTTGEDDNKLFSTYPNGVTSGSLYYSVMVKLDSVATTGDYFFHLYKNSSTFSARIFAKRAANGNIRFGIGKSSTAGNINYSDSIYTVGTTYLLVVKYTSIPGATNDTVALWIDPAIGSTEPAPSVLESVTDRTAADLDTVYGVAVRQGTAANAPIGTVDGIRLDTAWPLGGGGPLTGTKTIPGIYPTLSAAIADLNTLGVGPGGVTLDVAAGYTETITSTLSLTATGTAANPIVFQKFGTGANPLITAYATGTGTPSTAVQDGIWQLVGSDYVTIDGIDLFDPNVANPATMEYGYALYKASATDGCQNVTIQNCTITLNRVNNDAGSGPAVDGSRGIDVVNAIPSAATTALTVTAATGSNSNNRFYHNTIQNCNIGIALIGFADVTPFAFADQNNDVGGSSVATGNTIKNYGGAAAAVNPAAAIRTLAQYGINVSYNTINNNDGGGINHPSVLRGVYLNSATSANATVTFNTVTVNGGGTTALVDAIENASGSTAAGNAINISNNTVTNCSYATATSGPFYGIYNTATPATLTIGTNTISNSSTAATGGSYYAIYNSGAAPTAISINGNAVNGITFSSTSSLTFAGVFNSAGTATTLLNINGNNIQGITHTLVGSGTCYLIYNGGSCLNEIINTNTFTNLTLNTTGTIYLIYNSNSSPAGGSKTVGGNSVVTALNKTSASGTLYFYYNNASSPAGTTEADTSNNVSNVTIAGASTIAGWFNGDGGGPAKTFSGNTFSNLTAGTGAITVVNINYGTANIFNNTITTISSAGAITGILAGNSSTTAQNVYSNSIHTLASTGASNITAIISAASGASAATTIYKNNIYDLQADNAAGIVYGLSITAGTTVTAYNNFLDDFRTPSTSNVEAIRGISVTSSTTASSINLYYNSIRLNATSTGANFGTTGVYHTTSGSATTASLNMRNNVIVNTSTPAGTGLTVAYRRSSTSLTNYASTSNDNDFYAGTPSAGNVIYSDGTNSDQTIASYKSRVAPADIGSFSEDPPFIDAAAHNLHMNTTIATQCESGGTPVTSPFPITDDYDGDTRNVVTPDVGADEFAGIGVTPTLKDIQILSVSLATQIPQVGSPITVSAVIKNGGSEADPASVSLTYKANGSPVDSTDGIVQVFSPAWSGHEANVSFTTTYTPATAGSLTMWVRSFYPGDGDTTNDRGSATLNILAAGTFLSENFTGATFPPAGWAISSTGTTIGWSRLAATQPDGSAGFSARENFWSQSTGVRDTLKTPVMDLSSLRLLASPKAISFDHAYRFYNATSLDSVRIELSTNGGGTWPYVLYFDGSPNIVTTGGSGEFTPGSASDWRHHLIRIPDSLLVGSVRISFIGLSQFGNDYWLDNVAITTLADTDYALVALLQTNGIPTPFSLVQTRTPKDKGKPGQTFIPTSGHVRASNVNRSIMLDAQQVSSDKGVRAYLKGTAFNEGESAYSVNAQKPDTLVGVVTNFGLTSPSYAFDVTLDGVAQTPIPRPGIPFLASDTVVSNVIPAHRGTLTATGLASVANDRNPDNNSMTIYRVLSYPDTPVVRIRYDNGTNTPSTFIGFNGGFATTAAVRFRATANMRLANIDAFYRNEAAPDSIVLQVWAAGLDTTAPGIMLYAQTYGGLNYISAGGDYFTLPLSNNAPAFAAGSDYWVSIRFVQPITFPMGAQSTTITPGHSYISADSGLTWSPVVISGTEYAWLLRTVGTPATPNGSVIGSVVRSTRVPNAGDSILVTAAITDSLGTASATLLYMIDSVAQTPVPMPRISGTPRSGSYRAVIPGSANTNGARIEYQIRATSVSGVTTTTAVTANNSYFAGISPLSLTGVRKMNASRQILYANYYARITGTINGPNYQTTNLGFFMQDGFGGIDLFAFGVLIPFSLGDSLIVTGKIAQFRGLTEITPDTAVLGSDIVRVATGRPVPVVTLTLAAFNSNPEQYEGVVVQMLNMRRRDATPPWPTAGQSANIIVYQTVPADTTIMRIDSDTEIPGSPEPTYPVNVTGIISQFTSTTTVYNDGYETQPRYLTDFTPGNVALSGNYTVGAGGNFPTLDSAFTALTVLGVSGPVTLTLNDTVYAGSDRPVTVSTSTTLQPGRTDPLDPQFSNKSEQGTGKQPGATLSPNSGALTLRGPVAGASATNRITIRPATNKAVTINSTGSWGINLLNSSFVTIDGIGLTGQTRLSINAPSATTGGVIFEGNSDNNILQNTTVRTSFTAAEGVYLVADSATATPDSNTINGNAVLRAADGIVIVGNATSFPNANRILHNQIGSPTDSLGEAGVYIQQAFNTVIDGNSIENMRQAGPTFNLAGIWVATRHLNTQISNNVVHNVKVGPTTTAAVFAAGFYVFGTATDTTNGNYYNNMIYDLDYLGTVSGGTVRGIYASSGIRDTIAYNSIYLTGTATTVVTSGALYTSTHVGQVFRNNVVINARTETGTGRAMAFYKLSTTSTISSNYNDLYVPTRALSYVGGVGATNYATLANWETTGQDSQSVTVMANFTAPDLHIDSTVTTPLNGGARPIVGITTDIDGQARNVTTPDIGADEFNAPPPPTPGWTAQNSGITVQFYSVKAISQSVAWAAALGGRVLRTVNGGNTWTSVGGGHIGASDIYNIEAVDANTAFVTTSPAATYIFRTTNGGTSWDTVYTLGGTGAFIDAIKMTDVNNGFAMGDPVGGKWTIVRTSNSGTSWVRDTTHAPLQVSGETSNQNDLCILGSNIWYGSTANGRVYRSTDAGTTWLTSAVPGAVAATNVIAVWFSTPQYGIASAVNGTTYTAYRSTDGGATWSTVTVGTTTGYNIAVGSSGTDDFWMARGTDVYKSTDHGATWTQSYTGTGTFYDLDFFTSGSSTYGWGVKDNGNIVFYFGTIDDVKGNPADIPQSFTLLQNYPNPFNPTTTLSYALPKDARVTLTIYNILGQRVATLRDETENVGYYSVVWNGRNDFGTPIASGVYFYRIEARPTDGSEVFSTIKKMLMLK